MNRYFDDFALWAKDCVFVTDKLTGKDVPFILNRPQRRLLAIFEEERKAGRPIRIILLKARQWGGSTLSQVYMAWMQLVRHEGWNSVICAHVKDASAGIRGMYSRLLRCYPEPLKSGKGKDWVLSPYEKSQSVMEITARNCRVTLATAGAPNSVRGSNFHIAHLSEVAFWGDGDSESAEEIVRTISGSVPRIPDSMVIMESTANGKSNYFYEEWERAVAGKSDKRPVFVPWHEIEMYSREVDESEREALPALLDDYERGLLESGVSLESVAWYHDKRKEYPTHEAMMAEFPSTAEEAFSASGVYDTFGEGDLPKIVPAEEMVEEEGDEGKFLVVLPFRDPRHRLLQTFVYDGKSVRPKESLDATGTFPVIAARCRRWWEQSGGTVIVATTGERGDVGHAKWLLRRFEEWDMDVYRDEDDESLLVLDSERVSILVDLHHEWNLRGRIIESDSGMHGAYRAFRPERPEESPGVMARLCVLGVCDGEESYGY